MPGKPETYKKYHVPLRPPTKSKAGHSGVQKYINYFKLAIDKDVIFPSVDSNANILRWFGRPFHILLAEKRTDLAQVKPI